MQADPSPAQAETKPVILWDLPVRAVHWSFALLLPLLWWTAETGSIDWHKKLGYCMLALVVFRLLWAFFGSETARFSQFLKGPRAIFAYLGGARVQADPDTRRHEPNVGHNPLGGWSVLAMLLLLAAQTGVGLFTQDVDGLESGPLNYLISYEAGERAREIHEALFNGILVLVALHLLAIAFYLFVRKDGLLRPMLTGRRHFPSTLRPPGIAPFWRTLACAAVAAVLAAWLSTGAELP